MNVSLLQPRIIRGNIKHNLKVVQRLVNEGRGDLLVLPEYVLTGSLTLDLEANVHDWTREAADAKARINLPDGKYLLINSLIEIDSTLRNCCELLPTEEFQFKLFPDENEQNSGILPGTEQKIFELLEKRFKVVICSDLRNMDKIATESLDFLLFIYHFTESNFRNRIEVVKNVSKTRELPVLVISLVSDKNNGFSSFVDDDVAVSLPGQEGILEIDIQ